MHLNLSSLGADGLNYWITC